MCNVGLQLIVVKAFNPTMCKKKGKYIRLDIKIMPDLHLSLMG